MIDLVSQLASALPQANPALSPNASAPVEQDFSALLLQLIGNSNLLPQQPAAPQLNMLQGSDPQAADAALNVPQTGETQPSNTPSADTQAGQACLIPKLPSVNTDAPDQVDLPHLAIKISATPIIVTPQQTPTPEPVPAPSRPNIARTLTDTTDGSHESSKAAADALLADVKKFEITVQQEPLPAVDNQAVDQLKQLMITTDPITNLQQVQLPPRVIMLPKGSMESGSKGSDRSRSESGTMLSSDNRTSSLASEGDAAPAFQTVEQARPAQPIEIPQVPKLQIVRTVSMELGDPGSQVTVRIEDRSGGMAFHLGAGNEALHRSLEASVGSLVHALKQERIDIANVQVSRKSPIEKVRRMREARS